MTTTFAPPDHLAPVRPTPTPADTLAHRSRWLDVLPRLAVVLSLVMAIALGMWQLSTPAAEPTTVPATQFSADRAAPDVAVITRAPHPGGSAAHAAVQRYLVTRLRSFGLQPQVVTMTSTMLEKPGVVWAGKTRDVIARIPGTASTGAVLVATHYDSVPTGFGAGDCGGCVAAVLESARALKAGPPLKNDVIVLLVDAEEHSTLGSVGFMDQHPWAKDIRFALNVDSMANHGPVPAYFASRNNDWLMRQYFDAAPHPLSYSFFVDPFTRTNFGMDLKNYIRDGAVGIDAATFRNPQVYHSDLDTAAALEPGTLQHEGDNLLALARHAGNLDLRSVPRNGDAVFFNLTPDHGVIYSARLALLLGILVAVLFVSVLVFGVRQQVLTVRGLVRGFGVALGSFLAATIVVGMLWWVVKQLNPDYRVFLQDVPYDHDLYLVAFAATTVAVVGGIYARARRHSRAIDLAAGASGLCVVLALLTSMLLPGVSYIFTWPALLALLVLGWTIIRPASLANSWVHAGALAAVAVPALVLVTPVVYFLYQFMGRMELMVPLPVITLALLPATLLLTLLMPHIEFLGGRRSWVVPSAAVVVAVAFLGAGQLMNPVDAAHPRVDGVAYRLNADTGKANWISVGSSTDSWTKQFFPHGSQTTTFVPMPSESPDATLPALQTSAPHASLPAPRLTVLGDRRGAGLRELDLRVSSPRGAPNVEMIVKTSGRIVSASIDGRAVDVSQTAKDRPGNLRLEYYAIPRSGARVMLRVTPGHAVHVTVTDRSNGLPAIPGMTITQRPSDIIPAIFEMRDPTIVTKTFTLSA